MKTHQVAAVPLRRTRRPLARGVRGRGTDERRGAAAVEFAILLPLFLSLVFGIIEFSRALMVQQLLTSASREGARLGVLEGATLETVKTEVNNYLLGASVKGANVTCSVVDFEALEFGDPVTVTVSVPYADVSWLKNSSFLDKAVLKAQSTMRAERLQ